MQSSFKFPELFNSKMNNLYKNIGVINILSNPFYLSLIIVFVILILFLIIIEYKSTTSVKLFRFIFYVFIFICLLQLTNNYILKKEFNKKSSEYDDVNIINGMDDNLANNEIKKYSDIEIEPRTYNIKNISNDE